jgi:chromosome segregation ATPase
MATIEDVLTAVAQLGTELRGDIGSLRGEVGSLESKVGSLEGKVGSLDREIGSLRGEIERQGQELRGHIDHTAAMLKADLQAEMRERFDALLPDITSFDVMTRRLENAEQGRREIDEAMLKGLRRFGGRIERVEERVDGIEVRLSLKDKEPPAA